MVAQYQGTPPMPFGKERAIIMGIRISQPIFGAVPGFLWVILMGKGSVEARGKRVAFSKPRWARSVRPRGCQLPQGSSVCDKMTPTEGSHARCRTGPPRPRTGVEACQDPVHAERADLCRPDAQFPPERQRYEALTPFGKSGYSHYNPMRTPHEPHHGNGPTGGGRLTVGAL